MMKRYNRWTAIFMILLGSFLLSGCQPTQQYSFDDPDIFAYINGEPAYESQKDTYVEIKKAYYSDILSSVQENGEAAAVIVDPETDMHNKTYELELSRMKTVVAYSDEEWEKDYLRTFAIKQKLDEYVGSKQSNFEELLDVSVNATVKEALKPDTAEIKYYAGATLNVRDVINNVSKKLNLSYEDCAQSVYADFVKTEFRYQYLIKYFADKEFEGDKVEWDGSNIKAYTEYMTAVTTQYEEYLNGLVDAADIVKRP